MREFLRTKAAWWLIYISSLVPFAYLLYLALANSLGVEPGKALLDALGEIAITFLFITLALTPIKRFSGYTVVVKYRRMLGLFCLFYASLHVLSFGLFIVDWSDFFESVYKRPYVLMGACAFSILVLLGITSPRAMAKKLGRNWKALHKLIYLSAVFVIIHVWWQSRSDFGEPLTYALIFVFLMMMRVQIKAKLPTN